MSTNRFDMGKPQSTASNHASLLYISSAKYGGDWHSSPHSHKCTELVYVVGGTGGFLIENDRIRVGVDDLVVVNPLVQHTEVSWHASPLEYIVLGVEGLELAAEEHRDDRYLILNFRDLGGTVLSCMRLMLREIEQRLPGYETVCQNLLQVLIVQLQRQTSYSSPEGPERAATRESAAVKWYLDAHFKENITLDTLAQVARVNKYHMAHLFKEEYGISPIRYLNNKRIEESKQLLRSTDLSLSFIAQNLGFSSASYFSQSFRRHEGISPIVYREENAGK